MKIHADLTQRAVVYSQDLPWIDSPIAGCPTGRGEVFRIFKIINSIGV